MQYFSDDYRKQDRISALGQLHPQFPSHAETVFRLFKAYLETNQHDENPAQHNFVLYVTGMSFAKLEDRMREPKWKGRESRTLKMSDFLESNPEFNIDVRQLETEEKTI